MAEIQKSREAPSPKSVDDILKRAQQGDASTLPLIREVLEDPVMVESIGNVALQVQQSITSNAAGKNLLFSEAISKKMKRLRQDLSGKDGTPLEQLLVDRIVLCWLILHDAELRFTQSSNLSIAQAEYWQNRIDRAHRRYLSSIKTLATVRKPAIPVLQVNIAKRQTNIASGVSITGGDETKKDLGKPME